MITDDVAQAELQKEEIRKRLERLKDDLRLTQEAITRAEASLSFLEGYTTALAKLKSPDALIDEHIKRTERSDSPRNRIRNPSRDDVVDAALALIERAGRPLSRKELFDGISAQGITIKGKDPVMVFSTMLWRTQERIVRLRPFGYWPADKAYPPAQYIPGGAEPTLF